MIKVTTEAVRVLRSLLLSIDDYTLRVVPEIDYNNKTINYNLFLEHIDSFNNEQDVAFQIKYLINIVFEKKYKYFLENIEIDYISFYENNGFIIKNTSENEIFK